MEIPNSTYLGLTSNEGGRGRVVNLLGKQCRKSAMMAKEKQMANEADREHMARQTPSGHFACRFVEQTTGRIDLRLATY